MSYGGWTVGLPSPPATYICSFSIRLKITLSLEGGGEGFCRDILDQNLKKEEKIVYF